MLVDASAARSFAVVGRSQYLVSLGGGQILVAEGVHAPDPEEPSELRGIRDALQRQADRAGYGSRLASRALAAVHGMEQLLALSEDKLIVLRLTDQEFEMPGRARFLLTGSVRADLEATTRPATR